MISSHFLPHCDVQNVTFEKINKTFFSSNILFSHLWPHPFYWQTFSESCCSHFFKDFRRLGKSSADQMTRRQSTWQNETSPTDTFVLQAVRPYLLNIWPFTMKICPIAEMIFQNRLVGYCQILQHSKKWQRLSPNLVTLF